MLGLALILLPLLALSETNPEPNLSLAESVQSKLRQVDHAPPDGSQSSREIETLGVSFLIAFAAYGFLRTRRSRSERKVYTPYPPY
jgi:hypothetical protein